MQLAIFFPIQLHPMFATSQMLPNLHEFRLSVIGCFRAIFIGSGSAHRCSAHHRCSGSASSDVPFSVIGCSDPTYRIFRRFAPIHRCFRSASSGVPTPHRRFRLAPMFPRLPGWLTSLASIFVQIFFICSIRGACWALQKFAAFSSPIPRIWIRSSMPASLISSAE